jgi:hypothetical protein
MIFRLRNMIIIALIGVISWFGWSGYAYFFDTTTPHLVVTGLRDSGYYAGEVECVISSNKKGDVSLLLDGQPIISKFKIQKGYQEQAFKIPTFAIPNGNHLFTVEFSDITYHQNKKTIDYPFYVDNVPLQAVFVKADSELKVLQGRTLHLEFQVNKAIEHAQVHALASTFECFPESKNSLVYEVFIPITCEEKPSEYLLSVDIIDKAGNKLRLDNKFQVVMYPFKKERLHVDAEKIKKEEELGQAMKLFEDKIDHITQQSVREKLWRGAFCAPIDIQRVSCEFGTIRTTQHKGRYAHKAVDVINTPKSVVWAPQDGTVVLKERFDASGNTIVIDHGYGILSMFFHLDDFAKIDVGTKIAKGNPIGTLGKTGYATGYHLHWEMRVNNVAIDPLQWTQNTF